MRLLLRKLPAIAPIAVAVIATLAFGAILETPAHGGFVRAYATGIVKNLDTLDATSSATGDALTVSLIAVGPQSGTFEGVIGEVADADPDRSQGFSGDLAASPGENVFAEAGLTTGMDKGYARADTARYDGTVTGPPPTPPTLNGIGTGITTAEGGIIELVAEAQAIKLGQNASGDVTYFIAGLVTDAPGGDVEITVSIDLDVFLAKAIVDGFGLGFADASVEATLGVNGSGGTVTDSRSVNASSIGQLGGGVDIVGPTSLFLSVTAPVASQGQQGLFTIQFVANAMAEGGIVPEPAAWSLGAIGCLGLVLAGWRRRRRPRC